MEYLHHYRIPYTVWRLLLCFVSITLVPCCIHAWIALSTTAICRDIQLKCEQLCHANAANLHQRRQYKINASFLKSESTFICVHECNIKYSLCLVPGYLGNIGLFSLCIFVLFYFIAYPAYYGVRNTIPLCIYEPEPIQGSVKVSCPHCACTFLSTRLDTGSPTGVLDTLICPVCVYVIAGLS